MPLDRSLAATIARTGGRLAAVLLPLAAFAVVRLLGAPGGSLPSWVAPASRPSARRSPRVALLLTVAAHLERGRMRDVGDAAGLGLLAATLAGLAAGAVASARPGDRHRRRRDCVRCRLRARAAAG